MANKKVTSKKKRSRSTGLSRFFDGHNKRSKQAYGVVFIVLFAIIGTALYFISAAAPATPGFIDGQTSASGNWCMHDDNRSAASPDPIDVRPCDGLATQAWVFTGDTIRDGALSGTRCLQPSGGNTAVNTIVVAAACNGSKVQQWQRDGSSSRFINPTATAANSATYPNGICLALPDNNTHYYVGIRPCSTQYSDQNWATTSTVPVYQNPMRDVRFTRGRIDQ